MLKQGFASLIALVLSCAVPSSCHGSSQQSHTHDNLELAKSLFGPEVQAHPRLYELSRDYVLKLRLDKAGDVVSIIVMPKYYFEETRPEWREPEYAVGMTNEEYERTFSKVSTMKTTGPLMVRGTSGIVTNSKLWLLDQYQQAFVQRIVSRTAAEPRPGTPDMVHSFSVYFTHRIEGKVQNKTSVNQLGIQEQFKLEIKGCWYLTTKKEFDKARIGNRALLYAAGPIKDTREECKSDD